MNTNYTIAGKVRNSENILRLVRGIEDRGYSCYNFLHEPVLKDQADLSLEEQMDILESHPDFWNDPAHRHHFEKDLVGLKNADKFILLLPAGKASHMEAGIAYGLGKHMILIGEVEKPETLYLMFNDHFDSIADFINSL